MALIRSTNLVIQFDKDICSHDKSNIKNILTESICDIQREITRLNDNSKILLIESEENCLILSYQYSSTKFRITSYVYSKIKNMRNYLTKIYTKDNKPFSYSTNLKNYTLIPNQINIYS